MVRHVIKIFIFLLSAMQILACAFFSQLITRNAANSGDSAITLTVDVSIANPSLSATEFLPTETPWRYNANTPQSEIIYPSSTPSGNLSGIAFHDLNGDGLQGESEPVIADLRVCVNALDSPYCTMTDQQGNYILSGLNFGLVELYLQSPKDDPKSAFRYLNSFQGWDIIPAEQVGNHWVAKQELPKTRLNSLEKPISVEISPNSRLDLALTQGYLTDIFRCGERDAKSVLTFQAFDLDPKLGFVRHFYEEQSRTAENDQAIMFGDNHFAIDWGNTNMSIIGTPLYAPANGIVVFAGKGETWNGMCNVVNLVHPETGDSSGIVHLDTVLVHERQEVMRGQLLGTLGMSCTTWPHVHFYFKPGYDRETGEWEGRDPYRDTANPESLTYWTVDNQPVCATFILGGE
jgi:murein DD-endopeptidase MepM/ murein hydrolase activator NlpD